MNQRAMELANHLHFRARVSETLKDGDPLDYEKMRNWAPMLQEAGDLLMTQARALEKYEAEPRCPKCGLSDLWQLSFDVWECPRCGDVVPDVGQMAADNSPAAE